MTNKLERMLANPFYAIQIHPSLCQEHEPLMGREPWIVAQETRVDEVGFHAWLSELLDSLEDPA